MTDTLDLAMRDGMRALAASQGICACYSTTDHATGILTVKCCPNHNGVAEKARYDFGSYPKYERWFASEADARGRADIIYNQYPGEAYGTRTKIAPVGDWFMLLAWWGSAD